MCRAGLANKQRLLGEGGLLERAIPDREQAGSGNADDLVREERRELDSIVDLGLADEGKLDASGQQPLDHFPSRRDLHLDDDVRMVTPEAAERVG